MGAKGTYRVPMECTGMCTWARTECPQWENPGRCRGHARGVDGMPQHVHTGKYGMLKEHSFEVMHLHADMGMHGYQGKFSGTCYRMPSKCPITQRPYNQTRAHTGYQGITPVGTEGMQRVIPPDLGSLLIHSRWESVRRGHQSPMWRGGGLRHDRTRG
ncbi:hypothetical protein ACH5RR_008438 [Cinchona calisaya]|uniref:Uncharacterized protein n=1 Tax=Cinchona calisaya TaxID=153742 RepID=A0ABD3ABG9_9GENT